MCLTVLLFGRPTLRRTEISLKEYRNERVCSKWNPATPMRMNSLNSTGYQRHKIVNSLDCINFTNYFTLPNRPCMLRCVHSRINAFRHSSSSTRKGLPRTYHSNITWTFYFNSSVFLFLFFFWEWSCIGSCLTTTPHHNCWDQIKSNQVQLVLGVALYLVAQIS